MKRWLFGLVISALLSILTIACSTNTNTGGNAGASTNAVHTAGSQFVQSSITIPKGSMLTVVDDDAILHILANGSWVNGSPKPMQEKGAPAVNNVQFSNNASVQIGPFTTAGSYQIYCTVHPNMNLTVLVQ
jgi:plastocyanin